MGKKTSPQPTSSTQKPSKVADLKQKLLSKSTIRTDASVKKRTSNIQLPILETVNDDSSSSSSSEEVLRDDLSLHIGSKSEYEFVCKTCGGDHDETRCNNNYCPNCLMKHKVDNCPHKATTAIACEWCCKKGHTQAKCPMRQYLLTKDDLPKDIICFVCGEPGHVVSLRGLLFNNSKNCSTSYRTFSTKKFCFNCGKAGHSGLDCEDIKFDDILGTCLKDANYQLTATDSVISKVMVEKYKY